jgi:hypothetical protein
MNTMGLSQEDQFDIFSLLAGILHLGNVQFGDKNNFATVLLERGMFFSFRIESLPDFFRSASSLCLFWYTNGLSENKINLKTT